MRRLAAVGLAAIMLLAFAGPTAAARPYVVDVFAMTNWTDTGIQVGAGDELTISSRGSVLTAQPSQFSPMALRPGSGPAGQTWSLNCEDAAAAYDLDLTQLGECPVMSGYFGELVGMVNGHAFRIGAGTTVVIPQGVGTGNLFLAVNDYSLTYADNAGKFTVAFRF